MKGMTTMNFKNFTRVALVAMTLMLASSAFAASNTGSMNLTQPAQINGVQLAPGEYRVTWAGTGDNVTLTILQGKKTVATAQAHIRELSKAYGNDGFLSTPSDKGAQTIAELRFAGKKQAFAIGDEMAKINAAAKTATN